MQQNVIEQYQKEFQIMLMNEKVNFEVSPEWYGAAEQSLGFASPIALGVDPAGFKTLHEIVLRQGPISCFHFAVLNNNIENRSLKELEMSIKSYCDLMTMAGQYAILWNQQTQSFRKIVDEKIRKEQEALKQANDLKEGGFMKPVKAEA